MPDVVKNTGPLCEPNENAVDAHAVNDWETREGLQGKAEDAEKPRQPPLDRGSPHKGRTPSTP